MWSKEIKSVWDVDKQRIIGNAPKGCFNFGAVSANACLQYDWWNLKNNGKVVGYGWVDTSPGEAEISIAVDDTEQGKGYGSEILQRLENEVKNSGYRETVGIIKPENQRGKERIEWLFKRGYNANEMFGTDVMNVATICEAWSKGNRVRLTKKL